MFSLNVLKLVIHVSQLDKKVSNASDETIGRLAKPRLMVSCAKLFLRFREAAQQSHRIVYRDYNKFAILAAHREASPLRNVRAL